MGRGGLALFMVLSGFILARGTWGRSIAYGDFLLNRVIRIFRYDRRRLCRNLCEEVDHDGRDLCPFLLLQNVSSLSLTEPSVSSLPFGRYPSSSNSTSWHHSFFFSSSVTVLKGYVLPSSSSLYA